VSAVASELGRLLLKQEIEDFLYHEAELLDERRYDEWLDLFTEDARYWMPIRRNVHRGDPAREFTREGADVNWFDEGKETLTRRVRQIQTGIHWAEEPPSRICHMISNVQVLDAAPPGRTGAPAGASAGSGLTAWRPRPTCWSESARTCSAASPGAGRSPTARSSSTRASCSRRT
jgi:hypothetical protein